LPGGGKNNQLSSFSIQASIPLAFFVAEKTAKVAFPGFTPDRDAG
jgi:hypothetical protein